LAGNPGLKRWANFWWPLRGSPRHSPGALQGRLASGGDGVRFGIAVREDPDEVKEVLLLLGTKLEIADLTV